MDKAGIESKIVKINRKNALLLIKNGDRVFETEVTNLDYGGDGELDQCVKNALIAVM